MRYSIFNGGKRIRPALVYLVNQTLKGDLNNADAAACAIEAIHSYSLVHDDLPAMDNDDLRRGLPTCHIKFDHATAILAGDALQCIGFEWLCEQQNDLSPNTQLLMLKTLTRASGDTGMVAGQAFDLAHVDQPLSSIQLESMHRHKTGALINAAIQLGIHSANTDIGVERQTALLAYGDAIGLAFQVQDDILDITADTQTLGKPQGSDELANKPTYPSLLGLQGAKDKLQQLYQEALAAIECFDDSALALRQLATYIVERNH
ncbi:MAG: polyprenyl synthetase family protein [Oceanospirillaceae bacterium]|nr:polyprenyl synthetase family protein [Oceanospirillaceae bacterium]